MPFSIRRAGLWVSAVLIHVQMPCMAMAQAEIVAKVGRLANLVEQSLANQPEVLAAQAAVGSAREQLSGSALPLNNPELELEAERTDINTYSIGFSQTLDWHNKQDVLQQVEQARVDVAEYQLQTLKLTKSAELLHAVGDTLTRRQIRHLASERAGMLTRFVQLAEKRHKVGDIPLAELELARLSLAEARMEQAGKSALLVETDTDFYRLSGIRLPDEIRLPEQLTVSTLSDNEATAIARQHPAVVTAQGNARIARSLILAADTERKPDPTLGLSAGREDRENLLSLSLSIPMHLRNDFSSEVKAAEADSLQAEHDANRVFRDTLAGLHASHQRLQIFDDAWQAWSSLGRVSLQQRLELLERQWQTGELSSADYLLQIEQSLETQITAAELKGDRWNAWVEWLSASAQLDDWLYRIAKEQ
ncbi:MAG: TolC family protein [Candidatus Thiodiazotropha endolucinida]